MEIKTALYVKAGVQELWVVGLPQRILHRSTGPEPEEYREHTILDEDERLTPIRVPGKPLYLGHLLGG